MCTGSISFHFNVTNFSISTVSLKNKFKGLLSGQSQFVYAIVNTQSLIK